MNEPITKGYEIHIFYSEDAEGYMAEVSGPSHCAAVGESFEEAFAQANGAILAHSRLAREQVYAVLEPPAVGGGSGVFEESTGSVRLTLDLSEEQHAGLTYFAARSGSDKQRVLRALLRRLAEDEQLAEEIIEDLKAERVREVLGDG